MPLLFFEFMLFLFIVWFWTLLFLCYYGLSTHKPLWSLESFIVVYCGNCFKGLVSSLLTMGELEVSSRWVWVVSTFSFYCCILLFIGFIGLYWALFVLIGHCLLPFIWTKLLLVQFIAAYCGNCFRPYVNYVDQRWLRVGGEQELSA